MVFKKLTLSKNPALFLAGFFVIFSAGCNKHSNRITNQPVVKVHEEVLTSKVFADELAHRLKEFDALAVKDPAVISRNKEEVVKEFIISAITKHWAKQNNLFVRKEDLDAYVNTVRGYYPDDLAFRRSLSDEGLTFERWKGKVQISLLQRLIVTKLNEGLPEPTEKELKGYYQRNKDRFKREQQVKLLQIVLDTENNAKRIESELKKGKSFSELAKKFSVAPEASTGGELGWIEKGTLPVFDSVFDLPRKRRSSIKKSPFGYHIFKVLEKRKAKTLGYKDVKDKIKRSMLEKREQAKFSGWLEQQVRQARVFKNEKLIESISVETKGEHR